MKVSRATIRAGLQELEAMDLIETRKGAGSFVKNKVNFDIIKYSSDAVTMMLSRSLFSFKEIVQARKMCEYETVKLIATRNSLQEKDFEILIKTVEMMEKAIGQNNSDFQNADMKFHTELGNLSKNRIMRFINNFLYELFWHKLPSDFHVFKHNIKKQKELVQLHKGLIENLKRKDLDALKQLTDKHTKIVNDVANNYLNMIRDSESF